MIKVDRAIQDRWFESASVEEPERRHWHQWIEASDTQTKDAIKHWNTNKTKPEITDLYRADALKRALERIFTVNVRIAKVHQMLKAIGT